ncbi:alpha/beta hydrolase [Streptomyces sp. WMMC940]|uniref:alpha/beta hydrolase n=1 Tax=Streptomyces sp. WMMC940 TaxID=3015153 RepID=UPI0022B6F670|nr:alpha/beta hydrolase [Streptomyces sp. WMMC940]MCZ7462092.1 alpha/beta hydrolase [Streptomyces sp. WMMC940]
MNTRVPGHDRPGRPVHAGPARGVPGRARRAARRRAAGLRAALYRAVAAAGAPIKRSGRDRPADLRGRRATALLSAVPLALTAGAGLPASAAADDGSSATRSQGTAASIPSSVPEGLRPYYAQRIDWETCGTDVQCGLLEVPLDYADPAAGTIRLSLARVRAADPDRRLGSLLYNPGGPGVSGVDAVKSAAELPTTPELAARYDVVGFDPRGVGESAPVRCAPVRAAGDAGPVDITPDTPAEVDGLVRTTRETGAACRSVTGPRLGHVSTLETARDMDVLRAVLGDPGLNFLGVSYGTYLGTLYADLFPDRVGRLALDAAVDPRLDALESLRGQAAGFQRALDAFLADCASRPECPLGTDPARAAKRLTDLLARLDRAPLPVSGTELLDRDSAVVIMAQSLYSRDSWPVLESAVAAALAGNGTEFSGMVADAGEDSYGHSFLAISCLDLPPAVTSAEELQAALPSFREASPVFGEWLAWAALGCADWPVDSVGTPRTVSAPGTPPILVVGTTRDPATPYDWAESLAGQLESGVLLTREGDGHSAYNVGSVCVDRAVDRYLIEGVPPADGTHCT